MIMRCPSCRKALQYPDNPTKVGKYGQEMMVIECPCGTSCNVRIDTLFVVSYSKPMSVEEWKKYKEESKREKK